MYNFERITKERLSHLVILYKAAFNKKISIDFLAKKFDTERLGTGYLGFLAYDENNEPAAYYGVFPYLVRNGNMNIVTAQSGDTMTHPKHQGKGLFTTLAKMTYELAKNEGIDLVWGFPNKNSYPGFIKKLNWMDNEVLIKSKIKIRTLPVAKALNKIKIQWFDALYASICSLVLQPKLKEFIKKENCGIPFIAKDEVFFRYKNYIKNRIVIGDGKKNLWAKVESSLLIGDISCENLEDFNTLIDGIKSKCTILGITEIIFICNAINPDLKFFKQRQDVIYEDSLSYCHLADWDDNLAKSMSICFGDFDTF